MMKKLIVVLLAICAVQATAQENLKTLIDDFHAYNNLLIKKDFNGAMDYTNEGLFKIVSKEQLVEVMDQMFNNSQIDVEIDGVPAVSNFGAVKNINDQFYVKFNSISIIKMRFNMMYNSEKTDAENQAAIETLKQNLVTQFGAANVSYDDKTKFFTLKSDKPVIASSIDKKKWKFGSR
jgi:hypothetical protein